MSARKEKKSKVVADTRVAKTQSVIDVDGDGNGYSGTFRWNKSKMLQSMPSVHESLKINTYKGGWMAYLMNRCRDDKKCASLIKRIQSDLSMIDCLSSPLTIASMCSSVGLLSLSQVNQISVLNIICMG